MRQPSQIEDLAPEGLLWWCTDCGRVSGDRHGRLATRQGWTKECSEYAVLVKAETMKVEHDGRVAEADVVGEEGIEHIAATGTGHADN